jgi:hypothetical protein
MLVACGKIPDAETGPDGGGDDGDATPGPDATPLTGQATLVAHHDDGTPVVGATVVLTTHDGTLKMETVTGADGKVQLDITEGDIASVGWNEGGAGTTIRKQLYTVLALQVDDVVNLNNRTNRDTSSIGMIVVQTPPLPNGATQGNIEIGCNSNQILPGQTAVQMELRKDCIDSTGKFSVVADALDANGNTVATTVKVDLAPQAGQTVVLPAWANPGSGRVTLNLVNTPNGVKTFGNLEGHRHGIGYEQFDFNGTGANPGSLSVVPARGYIDSMLRSAALLYPDASDSSLIDGVVFLIAKEPYTNDAGATYTADFSKSMARIFKSKYDPTTHEFSWMVDTAEPDQVKALRNADIASIQMPWSDPGAPTSFQNLWVVIGPGTTSSPLKLDVHSLGAFAPAPNAGTQAMSVQVLDLDVVDGYKDAKMRFGTNFLESVDALPTFKGLAAFSGQLH